MKIFIILLSVIATLVPYAAIAEEYISNDELKQLLKESPIWCRDLDSDGCNTVTHYGPIKADATSLDNYALLSNIIKLKTSGISKFTKSGFCFTFNEAYTKSITTFITPNNFPRITDDDKQLPREAQAEFNSKMVEQLGSMFGKEYCARYEVTKYNTSGKISEVKATFFLEDEEQLSPLLCIHYSLKTPRKSGLSRNLGSNSAELHVCSDLAGRKKNEKHVRTQSAGFPVFTVHCVRQI